MCVCQAKIDIHNIYCVQENRTVKVFATPDNHPNGQPAGQRLIIAHTFFTGVKKEQHEIRCLALSSFISKLLPIRWAYTEVAITS